jgi:hypothetical protein
MPFNAMVTCCPDSYKAIKEIMVLIAISLQDSSEKLSGQQVAMALKGHLLS